MSGGKSDELARKWDHEERLRIHHTLDLMDHMLRAVRLSLSMNEPLGSELSNGLCATAATIAQQIARADAYRRLADAEPSTGTKTEKA
jgi:hypothetical protein